MEIIQNRAAGSPEKSPAAMMAIGRADFFLYNPPFHPEFFRPPRFVPRPGRFARDHFERNKHREKNLSAVKA